MQTGTYAFLIPVSRACVLLCPVAFTFSLIIQALVHDGNGTLGSEQIESLGGLACWRREGTSHPSQGLEQTRATFCAGTFGRWALNHVST